MNISKILLPIIFLTLTFQLSAWGYKSHYIIAEIAERHLTPNTKAKVTEMLKGKKMVYWADWMDKVRSDSTYDFVRTWHFANVDSGKTYETMPKTPTGDVVTATYLALEKVASKTENDSIRRMYLKFLIHLVGDLHCPVHAGRATDRGGNRHIISWYGAENDLHTVWDSRVLEAARQWSYTEWADNLTDDVSPAQIAEMKQGTPTEWFRETVKTADYIYKVTPQGQNQSYRYVYNYTYILERQLKLAGYRLAFVLNSIFDQS
jgi:hypothetical protein